MAVVIPEYVELVPKHQSWLMRLIRRVLPPGRFKRFWTTYRWPFQKKVYVHYPAWLVDDPLAPGYEGTLLHELEHAKDLIKTAGPWLYALGQVFPLPVFLSGRWFIERRAYLVNIRRQECSIEQAVQALWLGYGWPWLPALMRSWFKKQLADRGAW